MIDTNPLPGQKQHRLSFTNGKKKTGSLLDRTLQGNLHQHRTPKSKKLEDTFILSWIYCIIGCIIMCEVHHIFFSTEDYPKWSHNC